MSAAAFSGLYCAGTYTDQSRVVPGKIFDSHAGIFVTVPWGMEGFSRCNADSTNSSAAKAETAREAVQSRGTKKRMVSVLSCAAFPPRAKSRNCARWPSNCSARGPRELLTRRCRFEFIVPQRRKNELGILSDRGLSESAFGTWSPVRR